MRGPAPIPIPLQVLRGNPGKKSVRIQLEPERLPEVPNPPKFLEGYAQAEWRRVAPSLHTLGLLSTLDIMPLAAYCVAYQHWRQAEERLGELAAQDESRGLLVKVKERATPAAILWFRSQRVPRPTCCAMPPSSA